MKNRMSFVVLCLVSCSTYGMHNPHQKKVVNPVVEEKKAIFEDLLSTGDYRRPKAMRKLRIRCAQIDAWPKLEKEIAQHVHQIDLFLAFAGHRALAILKRRAVKFNVRKTGDLEIKQDLICIDNVATKATKAYKLERDMQDLAACEIHRVKQSLVDIIKKLENEIEDLKKVISPPLNGGLNFPSVQTLPFIVGCNHEYPQVWNGIFPPPCRKCGYVPPNHLIVTCENKNE